ncbi:hypothetical protein HDV05_006687, partial [Chytridiales sp. JEL 0842]
MDFDDWTGTVSINIDYKSTSTPLQLHLSKHESLLAKVREALRDLNMPVDVMQMVVMAAVEDSIREEIMRAGDWIVSK